jgi:hypothetical protein
VDEAVPLADKRLAGGFAVVGDARAVGHFHQVLFAGVDLEKDAGGLYGLFGSKRLGLF